MVKLEKSKKGPKLRHGSNINQSSEGPTYLDPLPAEDAGHGGQGREEEYGEARRQDQDHALLSLRILIKSVRFCQLSA